MKVLYNDFEYEDYGEELSDEEFFADEDEMLLEETISSAEFTENTPDRVELIMNVCEQLEDVLTNGGIEFEMYAEGCRYDLCTDIVIEMCSYSRMNFREQRRFVEILEEADSYSMTEEETGTGRLKVTLHYENALL